MIKNPRKFIAYSESERRKRLQRLTYLQSARITEAMISSSSLLRKMHFKDDDHPIALFKQVQLVQQKKQKQKSKELPISSKPEFL